MEACTLVVVPGLGDSGPQHWQSSWAEETPRALRVRQRDWDHPALADWIETLDQTVKAASSPPVLVAHSLGCALVAHWFLRMRRRVTAALLVAPADVDSPAHTPDEVRCFRPMPLGRLPFPTTVVASDDDPYVAPERARWFAQHWGSRFVLVAGAGHLNADSKLGRWDAGKRLLDELVRRNAP
jgi:predicted alpha/beta hydrolase family esterase